MRPPILLSFLLLLLSQFLHAEKAPSGFIPNKGQWPNAVRYAMDVQSGKVFLESDAITYVFYDGKALERLHGHQHEAGNHQSESIAHHALKMKLLNASSAELKASDAGKTNYNYYLGNKRKNWASNLHAHRSVQYSEIFPSTDLKVYTHEQGMKYDFILRPGANPNTIKWTYEGAESTRLKAGTLVIGTSLGEMIELAPVAWQETPSGRVVVDCRFTLNKGIAGFELGNYDHSLPLIIDPQIVFATYSGSFSDNWGFTATYDLAGNGYSGGIVFGVDFPVTTGAYQVQFGGGQLDIGILKYSPDGTQGLYVTFIGGSDMELPHSLIANENGELIIFGTTGSSNFPVTAGAYKTNFTGGPPTTFENGFISVANGTDIFVSRLSADGSALLASTFAGGSGNDGFNSAIDLVFNYADEIRGSVWVDEDNNIFIGTSTSSNDIPTANSFQPAFGGGAQDGVIFKFNENLNQLLWASYLGGSGDDGIFYLHVDNARQIVVTGGTTSSNFPMGNTAFQSVYEGQTDGFVTRIDSSGQSLIGSTYIGSSLYDQSYISGSDKDNNIYLFGQTNATGNEFAQNSSLAVTGGNQFITKFDPLLQNRIWSTTFGNATGQPDISPTALLVDVCDKIYVSGWGGSVNQLGTFTTGLPITADAFQSTTDGSDFYLYVIDNNAQNVEYASFLGGTSSPDHVDGGTSRFDRKGIIYQSICASCGGQTDLPVSPGAFSPTNNSTNCNNALIKFDFEVPLTISSFVNNNDPVGCAPYTVSFNNTSINAQSFSWRIDDTEVGTAEDLEYTFDQGGTYEVTLITFSDATCNLSDTVSLTVSVIGQIEADLDSLAGCIGSEVTLGSLDLSNPYYTFQWSPTTGMNDPEAGQPSIFIEGNVLYKLIVTLEQCSDTLYQQVSALGGLREQLDTADVCLFDTAPIGLTEPYAIGAQYTWQPSDLLNNPSVFNPLFDAQNSIDYTILVTLPDGCTDTLDLHVNARTESFDAGPDLNVCAGQSVAIGIADSTNEFSYVWSPGNILNDSTLANPIATLEVSTQFTVFRIPEQNNENCPGEGIRTVNIVAKPIAAFSPQIDLGCDGVSVSISDSASGFTELIYEINAEVVPESSIQQLEFPYSDSLTILQVAINGECRDTLAFSTFIEALDKYYEENSSNVFSPNNDGLNDCFSPALSLKDNVLVTDFLPCSDLYVYDRWGKLIYASLEVESTACWDGNTKSGNPCDEGVYYYVYRFKSDEKAGIVHLRR